MDTTVYELASLNRLAHSALTDSDLLEVGNNPASPDKPTSSVTIAELRRMLLTQQPAIADSDGTLDDTVRAVNASLAVLRVLGIIVPFSVAPTLVFTALSNSFDASILKSAQVVQPEEWEFAVSDGSNLVINPLGAEELAEEGSGTPDSTHWKSSTTALLNNCVVRYKAGGVYSPWSAVVSKE